MTGTLRITPLNTEASIGRKRAVSLAVIFPPGLQPGEVRRIANLILLRQRTSVPSATSKASLMRKELMSPRYQLL